MEARKTERLSIPASDSLGMKGYWIEGDGVTRVEFERPTFWQRVWVWLFLNATWVDYK